MKLAQMIAQRSKDPATQCGAVITTPDHRIVSMGYNGPPRGIDDATVPWDERPAKYSYVIHSEMNAMLFALEGMGARGNILHVSARPCSRCCLFVVHLGLVAIYFDDANVPRVCDEDDWALARRILEAGRVPWYTDHRS